MKSKIRVSVAGASGYAGGELIRLLLLHPAVEIIQVSSERHAGENIKIIHPNLNLKSSGRQDLVFCSLSELKECDLLFLALPHKKSMELIDDFMKIALRIIDLSADFRLNDKKEYEEWYGFAHPRPDLLEDFVYGIPEIHREEMREANYISSAGCNATAVILGLYPFYKNKLIESDRTVVEVKAGTSQAGNKANESSHHPVRKGSVRTYAPAGHRHTAEMLQELSFGEKITIHFSACSIDLVRGVHASCHLFLRDPLRDRDIWDLFRSTYANEPFIRIIKSKRGIHRFPDPKILAGTNYCDLGFELDRKSNRLLVFSSLDNLMKGAAGQAVQAFNIMQGLEETEGLGFLGLYPN
jgi:N-acetyl-gamma-glutamyl-phosphate/LysW-gamma-L-alpha-aminoadipyl-6-phosphate reductase